jgi:methionine-rich copper-binding protein CopC
MSFKVSPVIQGKQFVLFRGLFISAISIFLLGLPSVAHSHTSLLSSEPKVDSVVQIFPSLIRLEFGESLLVFENYQSNYFEVISPSGKSVKMGDITVDGPIIEASVEERVSEQGIYKILYRVVAGDGHVLNREFSFTYMNTNSTQRGDLSSPQMNDSAQEESLHQHSSKSPESSAKHQHQSFFSHHLEHLLMFLILGVGILIWFLYQRAGKL